MRKFLGLRALPAVALGLICLGSATLAVRESHPAEAAWSAVDITSAGPLTDIFIGNNLSCQVAHTGDAVYEMYDPYEQEGDCGTWVLVGGTSYGVYWGDAELTPVSQSGVTGSGTSGSPYQVVTVADAGASGIRITETDSYVVGDEFYRTDVQVSNSGNAAADVRIYRGADCYLGGSDSGYGYADPVGKSVACTENQNNSPAGRVEMWTPITPASHYQQGHYSTVLSNVENHTELTDTCDCSTQEDNGAMIDWNVTVPAGGNTTVSSYSAFSPTGVGLPNQTPTAAPTTPAGGPTPCIPGIPESRCFNNPPAANATPKVTSTTVPEATATSAPATATSAATVAPPQPTATQPGGGAAGVISAPNTGSGPGGSGLPMTALFVAALLLAGGVSASAAAYRLRR
jgi:hypothetical protein